MRICTCCHQTIPEKLSLVDRVIGLLANSSEPLPPRAIRKALGSGEGTTQQTLRRLEERGVIRKSTTRFGSGWVLTDLAEFVSEGGTTAVRSGRPLPAPEPDLDTINKSVAALGDYLAARGELEVADAVAYLVRMGCPQEDAGTLVDVGVTNGLWLRDRTRLVAK